MNPKWRLAQTCWLVVVGILQAAACSAQIDLSWRNCVIALDGEPAPTSDQTFDCTTARQYVLVASFKLPVARPAADLLNAYIDIESEAPGLIAPFWHFTTVGTVRCNSGLSASAIRGQTGGCAGVSSAWNEEDPILVAAVVSEVIDINRQNRARLLVGVFAGNSLAAFNANQNYYAFHLTFNTNNAATCTGCSQPMALVWNEVRIYTRNDAEPVLILTGSDKGSSCATINGATAGTCATTPTRNMSWGMIKSLYR